jgi:hypothetical protein
MIQGKPNIFIHFFVSYTSRNHDRYNQSDDHDHYHHVYFLILDYTTTYIFSTELETALWYVHTRSTK